MEYNLKFFRRSVRSVISHTYNWFVKMIIKLGSDRNIWEGTYPSIHDIPVKNNNWEYFTDWQFNEVNKIITNDSDRPNEFFVGDRALFPLLVTIIGQEKTEIKILDIGGGTCFDYLSILHCSNIPAKICYYIVEIPELIDRATDFFAGYPDVKFIANSHDMPAVPDVVLFNSTLQYFDDYRSKLLEIAALNPEYILFIRFSGGKFSTYLTKQVNIPDVETPYWFINIDELSAILGSAGYMLAYQSRGDCEYYQGNFPESYRMKRTWNLLFKRRPEPEKS